MLKIEIMILSIAWKNIWRNKLRSSVILIAMTLGLTAGVFMVAFFYGMAEQRINTAIKTEASHIQIHQSEYLQNPDLKKRIDNGQQIASEVQNIKHIQGVSDRLIIHSMVASAETGSGVKITGINPQKEMGVTNIHEKIVEGKYFDGIKRNPVVIGRELADKLNVKLRSKIIIRAQEANGTLTGGSFRVVGIYETSNTSFDEMNVFVRKSDLSGLLKVPGNSAHEIAILLDDSEYLNPVLNHLKMNYPQLDIRPWNKLMPEVGVLKESLNVSMYLFLIIILLALAFSIVNTMLMAVLERIKEIGMLMAIGMNRRKVFAMIISETVMLTLVGGGLGIVFGGLITYSLSETGIDLSMYAKGFEAYGYEAIVYPELKTGSVFTVTALVVVVGLLSGIYPAIKALKLNPAEAIRTDN
jgi:ABC-type lipoprotein release transport system permease subunit